MTILPPKNAKCCSPLNFGRLPTKPSASKFKREHKIWRRQHQTATQQTESSQEQTNSLHDDICCNPLSSMAAIGPPRKLRPPPSDYFSRRIRPPQRHPRCVLPLLPPLRRQRPPVHSRPGLPLLLHRRTDVRSARPRRHLSPCIPRPIRRRPIRRVRAPEPR